MYSYRERQRADRLHYAYLKSGPSDQFPFQPELIPGTMLLRIDDDGLMAMTQTGEIIFRHKREQVRLPITYSNRRVHGQTIRKINRLRVQAQASHLFHPRYTFAPSIEMLDRYFQLLYHPVINGRVRASRHAQEQRHQHQQKQRQAVEEYLLSMVVK